jgi:hypothetical protein
VELLILIFIVGLLLGYCILHPIKSVKYLFMLVGIMILGLIGVGLLFSIPWALMHLAQ